MADNKVKFLRGTSAEYKASPKDKDTFYYTTDTKKLYLGETEITSIEIDDTSTAAIDKTWSAKKISDSIPTTLPANGGNADTVNNHTVEADVPTDAKFTDTVYTHPTSGVTAGTYKSVTVDNKGHVTAGSNPTTLAGYGITDAAAKSHTHDDRYYTESEINTKLNAKLNTSLKGAASGLAELDANGKVPSAQLPSYVDDVLEYTAKTNFPSTGETGKIYVDTTTNKTYRWSGSAYVEISASIALGETSSTAYRGDRGKIAYDHSQTAHAPSNAEANVQSDWNATDTASDAYIKNKPTSLPANGGTASKANTLSTARTIDGMSFNGSANITHYASCSTEAATAAKVVSLTGFTLATGAKIAVKFTVTNTAANPTLNVNNTGAKAIYYRGAAISAGYLAANRTYEFVYNGTQYELIGDVDTNTDTHWTSKNIVGASATATANAAATNGNVYMNHLENSSVKSSHKIVGSGATKVISDASGNITISSTDTNTDTKVTAVGNHYTPSGGTTTSASGGTLTDITNSSRGVQVVTGVTKDAAGHVTGVTSVALKSVNTTYSAASGSAAGIVSTSAQTFAGNKTFNGQVIPAGASDVGTAQARKIYAGTNDMTAGTSELETGAIYLVYE